MQIRPLPTTLSKNTLGGRLLLVQCPGAWLLLFPQGKSQPARPCPPSEAPSLPQAPHHTGLECLAEATRAWAIGAVREKCQGRKRARAGFSGGGGNEVWDTFGVGDISWYGCCQATGLTTLWAKAPCLPSKSRSMRPEFSNYCESCGTYEFHQSWMGRGIPHSVLSFSLPQCP